MNVEIICTALENLEYPAHMFGQYKDTPELDGHIVLHFPYRPPLRMVVETRKELRKHQLPHLIEKKKEFDNFLLVAGNLLPSRSFRKTKYLTWRNFNKRKVDLHVLGLQEVLADAREVKIEEKIVQVPTSSIRFKYRLLH